jgi:hypothetical protein
MRWGGPLVDCHVALRWGPPVRWLVPTCWRGPMRCWHVALSCWGGLVRCWHVAPSLSSLILCVHVWDLQFAPRWVSVPKLHPDESLIEFEPLISLFNLFYLLWIYFNSSTYPKIMKFSPNWKSKDWWNNGCLGICIWYHFKYWLMYYALFEFTLLFWHWQNLLRYFLYDCCGLFLLWDDIAMWIVCVAEMLELRYLYVMDDWLLLSVFLVGCWRLCLHYFCPWWYRRLRGHRVNIILQRY